MASPTAPSPAPSSERERMQYHLDEVIFCLLIHNPTAARLTELMQLRERIEQLLDADLGP